jgi:two-component system, response regulator FlrC
MTHTILVVDDDAGMRQFLAMVLAAAGYEPVTASSVPAAKDMLRNNPPDLLITDVRIHGYNGLQLLLIGPEPHVPAIVITGFVDQSIESDAHTFGADFLAKPIDPSELCALVGRKLAAAA